MKIYILFIALLVSTISFAQQVPLPFNYSYQPDLYNPALMGSLNSSKVFVARKTQWTQFGDLAPVTNYFVFNSNLLRLKEENSALSRIGWGISALTHKIGLLERSNFGLSGSYFAVETENTTLSLGFTASYWNNGIDFQKMSIDNIGDGSLWNSELSRGNFNADAGINLTTKLSERITLSVGATGLQLLSKAFDYGSDSISYKYQPNAHFLGSLGVNIVTKSNFEIMPLLMVRGIVTGDNRNLNGGVLDAGLQLAYPVSEQLKLYLGGGIRTNNPDISTNGLAGQYASFRMDFRDLSLHFIAENNTDLGTSFEVGAGFVFSKKKCNVDKAELEKEKSKINNLIVSVETLHANIDSERKLAEVIWNDLDKNCLFKKMLEKALTEVNNKQIAIRNYQEEIKRKQLRLVELKKNAKRINCDKWVEEVANEEVELNTMNLDDIIANIEQLIVEAEEKPIWGNQTKLEERVLTQNKQIKGKSVENRDCSALIFKYNDEDNGEYVITNMRGYKEHFETIQTILKETQTGSSSRKINSISITIRTNLSGNQLKKEADIQYGDEFPNLNSAYIFQGKKSLNLEDGDDLLLGELMALKGLSLKNELIKKLEIDESKISIEVIAGRKIEELSNIELIVEHQ